MESPRPASWLVRPAVPFLSWLTARYICHHRRKLIVGAKPIPDGVRAALKGYFPDEALNQTRIIQATMRDPKFYPLVRLLGIDGLLEMSSIGAITLVDVIAYPQKLARNTLFHELVHVVQYRVLGLPRFADLYLKGFLNGGGYEGIPLERQAYELEERFSRNPNRQFSVEDEVVRRHEKGLL